MTSSLYTAAAVNRSLHAACIASSSSHALFGSHKLVAFWDASDRLDRGVSYTLPGHEHEVVAVKWIKEGSNFVSGDQGGNLFFWTTDPEKKWTVSHKVQAHARGISALTCYDRTVVSGSSDGVLKVFEVEHQASEPPTLKQTIDLRGRFPLSIEVARLPDSSATVMAVAGTDKNIRIFTRSEEQFVSSLSLEGHEDWVKCLSFSQSPTVDGPRENLVLASGSQDGYIRLWLIAPAEQSPAKPNEEVQPLDELLDAFERNLGEMSEDAEEGGKKISMRSHVFGVNDSASGLKQHSLTFDALLIGHEAGVTSLSWQPQLAVPSSQPSSRSTPTLLSTSTDSSLILWSPSEIPSGSADPSSTTSIWTNRQRFGDVGGGKPGGFIAGYWGAGGREIMGVGWNGSWRRWRNVAQPGTETETDAVESWLEVPAPVGHCGPVRGIAWDPEGDYLISTSLDQTTRIHGAYRRSNSDGVELETWHELARPQIHGYDVVSATFLSPLKFVSVSDEKVARVFEAPKGFVKTVQGLGSKRDAGDLDASSRPVAAVVPPLGLSNKATAEDSQDTPALVAEEDAAMHRRPPLEPELSVLTLWPEMEKVFGHGYELFAVASSHDGSILATSCKSTSAEHAVVRLNEATSWRSIGLPLSGHALTITRIAFGPDDRLILTASRDRSWRLFRRGEDGGYVPLCATEKAHARVIWDCAWAKEGRMFATAGRDKMVKIWTIPEGGSEDKWTCSQTIKLEDAATAVDFQSAGPQQRVIAIGLESGQILIYEESSSDANAQFELRLKVDKMLCPVDQIHRLAWRPTHPSSSTHELAVCGDDRSVRILRIALSQ